MYYLDDNQCWCYVQWLKQVAHDQGLLSLVNLISLEPIITTLNDQD